MKVKAFLSIEMDIDVSEFNEKYVRVRDLAIDLTKKEIAHNLLHHNITEDDFEYYIPDGGNDDTIANKITNELLTCIITVGASEAFKSFIDMRYALANKDWNTIKSMYGGRFSPWCSDTYIKDFDTALNNILPFANSCILTANEIRSAFGSESLDDSKPEVDKVISSWQEFVKSCDHTVNELRSAFGFETLDDPKPEHDAQINK